MTDSAYAKELLVRSFADLLQTEPFGKITVGEITSRCSLSKRTFYNHFKDKYDLALWWYTHQLDVYFETHDTVTFADYILYGAQVLWNDGDLIRNIGRYAGQNDFPHSLLEPLAERYLRIIREAIHGEPPAHITNLTIFYVGGMISCVEREIWKPQPNNPGDITAYFIACLPQDLSRYLRDLNILY